MKGCRFLLLSAAMPGASCRPDTHSAGNIAVAPNPERSTMTLVGTQWQLDNLCGGGVLDRVQAPISFPVPGSAVGNGSCNSFFGTVKREGDLITFGPLAATRMACVEPVSEQESRYLSALENAQRFQLKDQFLLIYIKGEDKPLHFHKDQVVALYQGCYQSSKLKTTSFKNQHLAHWSSMKNPYMKDILSYCHARGALAGMELDGGRYERIWTIIQLYTASG